MQLLYLFISLLVVLSDQSLKFFITNNYHIGEVHKIVPNILSFNYIQNNGAAWNILSGQMWLFYIISILAILFCLYTLLRTKYTNIYFNLGISLILGGIIGNFIDRIHLKYVIDMIQLDFIHFNIFNIADSAITIGIIIIIIYLLIFEEKENKNEK